MRIVDKSESLANPNICVICKETPKPASERVIDTQYSDFDDFSHTQGQKYICERCGGEIANLLDYVSATQAKGAIYAASEAATQLANVRIRVEELANNIAEFVKHQGAGDVTVAVEKFIETSPAASAVEAARDEVAKSYEDVFGAPEPATEKPKKAASKDSTVGSKPEA